MGAKLDGEGVRGGGQGGGAGERAAAEDRGQGEVVGREAPREHVTEGEERLRGAAGARERGDEGVEGGERGGSRHAVRPRAGRRVSSERRSFLYFFFPFFLTETEERGVFRDEGDVGSPTKQNGVFLFVGGNLLDFWVAGPFLPFLCSAGMENTVGHQIPLKKKSWTSNQLKKNAGHQIILKKKSWTSNVA